MKNKIMKTFEEHSSELNISDVMKRINDLKDEYAEWEDRRVNVSDLDITIRLHELLAMNKINYLNQLCYTTKDELMKYYNFCERSVMELEEIMAQNGLLLFGTIPQKINTNI